MSLALRVIITALGLWVAAVLIEGIRLDPSRSPLYLLLVALVVGLLNAVVRPILTLLSLPIVIATLGVFLLVVNAITLAIALALSARFDLGLTSDGFGRRCWPPSSCRSSDGWRTRCSARVAEADGAQPHASAAGLAARGSARVARQSDDVVDAGHDGCVEARQHLERTHVLGDLLRAVTPP
jgi:putative membrane protein